MPNPLDLLKSLTAKYQLPPQTAEEQQVQDAFATAKQATDPGWMKAARAGIDGVVGFTKGVLGVGDQGPAGPTATNAGQLLAAAAPFAGLKGLYSRVGKAAELLPDAGALPGSGVLNRLKRAPEGISPEEMSYRGLGQFLEGNPQVTKPEVMAHLDAHPAPQVGVKTLDQNIPPRPLAEQPHFEDPPHPNQTKFAKYQVPGGDNYQETLLNLDQPHNVDLSDEALQQWHYRKYGVPVPSLSSWMGEGVRNQFETETLPNPYQSPHWDDPNVLAHVRHNERTLPDLGKGRFIEELQSDWHQQGKERGYQPTELPPEYTIHKDAFPRSGNPEYNVFHADNPTVPWAGPYGTEEAARARALALLSDYRVPDAPFKTTWPDLAMKQQLLDVAGNKDLNWLGMTTGKTQAERYDLSKQLSAITYNPRTTHLNAYAPDGTLALSKPGVAPGDLSDHIGKEAANRLLHTDLTPDPFEGPGHLHHALGGLDLQVGGEGMKKYYDETYPNKLAKLLKPFGGTVEPGSIPGPPVDFQTRARVQRGLPGFEGEVHQDGVHVASTWPREPSGPGAIPNALMNADEVAARMQQQTRTATSIPAWIAKLSPEMKAAILKKGFPLMSLLGLIGAQPPPPSTPPSQP